MEAESDDDYYVDAVPYDDIGDDDMRVTNLCKPLSMYSSLSCLLSDILQVKTCFYQVSKRVHEVHKHNPFLKVCMSVTISPELSPPTS